MSEPAVPPVGIASSPREQSSASAISEDRFPCIGAGFLRACRSSSRQGSGPNLVVVLPIGTTPRLVHLALASLSRVAAVHTWIPRLVLESDQALLDSTPLSLQALSQDLQTVMDGYGLERAAILGYCSGAAVALHSLPLLGPRIDSLMLVHGAFFPKPADCDLTQYERDVMTLMPMMAAGRNETSQLFRCFGGNSARPVAAEDFAAEFRLAYANPESLYRLSLALDALIQAGSAAAASRVAVPTFIASGGRDAQTHPASAAWMRSLIEQAETYQDPEGDHYELCRGNPVLLDRLAHFIQRTSPR